MPHMARVLEMVEETLGVHGVLQLSLMVVVAAVVEREGRILIGQRKLGGKHPLKWEFPGGKVEPGEEPRAALARELREELAIAAEIGAELDRYDVRYGDGPLTHLIFYRVTKFGGEPRNLDFEQIAWAHPESLPEYDFLAGDRAFIAKLLESAKMNRMGPRLGNHGKIDLPRELRVRAREFYAELLGCRILESPEPDLDLYEFDGGFVLGLFLVDAAEALSEADHLKAAWLEIKVENPAAYKGRLLEFGVKEVEYPDPSHFYFQAPGGQVFRIASVDGGL
jgi:8-oxo-dGTP diphosphatase